MTNTAALDRACALMGSQLALATSLKIRSPSISDWRKRGRVPVERCGDIEVATRGLVTRYDLRPDVFGTAPPTDMREVG